MTLTEKQLELLQLHAEYTQLKGLPPTITELAGMLGINKVSALDRIAGCIKRGAMERTGEPGESRALRITPAGRAILGSTPARPLRWSITGTLSDKGIGPPPPRTAALPAPTEMTA